MVFPQSLLRPPARGIIILLLLISSALASTKKYVEITDESGMGVWVPDGRKPALYTRDFGDCMGGSTINVTRFDAAYYQDNMTVLFHLEGHSDTSGENLMMYIGVFAYGLPRFNLVFNPCHAQIYSLCPMNRSVPIQASGIIPVSQSDVAGIPPLALSIPDFEGQAILRIFSNTSRSEIGCYSGIITNGATFSHPKSVGLVVGIFVAAALLASSATAIYGNDISIMRTHHAHSVSILVIFAVLQHVYFTGALSLNWPSVLVSFWDNFAWSGGMIYSRSMQNSINQLAGGNYGNLSEAGAVKSNTSLDNLGGGVEASAIYNPFILVRRLLADHHARQPTFHGNEMFEDVLMKRAASLNVRDEVEGFSWYGSPVAPGLPIPGNFSGFAGTLSKQKIPASNAFMTGFLWLSILIALSGVALVFFKWALECLIHCCGVKAKRFDQYRVNWVSYVADVVLRILFIAVFMIMTLATFQFASGGSSGIVAIVALVFIASLLAIPGFACYACLYRGKGKNDDLRQKRLCLVRKRLLGKIPWITIHVENLTSEERVANGAVFAMFLGQSMSGPGCSEDPSIHEDEDFVRMFGWLSARFRRTRWWFFAFWLVYEFIRACFYGGATDHALIQVFGLIVVEVIVLTAMIIWRPFEGARLNALMTYLLGTSKILTLCLCAAFDKRFNLSRIRTTVIGIVIIVLHGLLICSLLVAILSGLVSSYLSLTRHQEDEEFRPCSWAKLRQRYFDHIDEAALDRPTPISSMTEKAEEAKEPYFRVTSMYRHPKIEDEDTYSIRSSNLPSSPMTAHASRVNLVDETNTTPMGLPYGAKAFRVSWRPDEKNTYYGPSPPRSRRQSHASFHPSNRNTRALSLQQTWTKDNMTPMRVPESPVVGYDERIRIRQTGENFPIRNIE